VTIRAESNQVRLDVRASLTAELLMVYLQIRHRSAELTPPTVTTQDLLAQKFVFRKIQAS
jgi:hypothetical protein